MLQSWFRGRGWLSGLVFPPLSTELVLTSLCLVQITNMIQYCIHLPVPILDHWHSSGLHSLDPLAFSLCKQ